MLLFGNDSDAGFVFLEAALPLIPPQDRAQMIRDAWSHGVFGEHARDGARRLRGSSLAIRTANLFRAVTELRPATLPESMPIYRGVRARNDSLAVLFGMSPAWTYNREVAAWFALRRGDPDSAWILETVVTPDDVLAVIDDRSEAEVVVDTSRIAFRNITAGRPSSEDAAAVAQIIQRRQQEYRARLASVRGRQGRESQ